LHDEYFPAKYWTLDNPARLAKLCTTFTESYMIPFLYCLPEQLQASREFAELQEALEENLTNWKKIENCSNPPQPYHWDTPAWLDIPYVILNQAGV
jgi:hypothetical protein